MVPQRHGCTLVEENAHSSNFQGRGGVFQDSASLLQGHAWKPFDEIRKLSAILQIFEESDYRDARASKYPSAAYALWVTLDNRTRRPVNHGLIRALKLGVLKILQDRRPIEQPVRVAH